MPIALRVGHGQDAHRLAIGRPLLIAVKADLAELGLDQSGVHAGDPDACDDNRAYAELARELLTTDLDVAITLKHASEPDAGGWAIYEESATGEPPINANPHGCSIEG